MKKKKNILLLGASKGIGKKLALLLSKDKSLQLFVVARNRAALNKLKKESKNSRLTLFVCDVLNKEALLKVKKQIEDKTDSLDGAVQLVGGYNRFGTLSDLNTQDWLKTFELNVGSTLNCAQVFFDLLKNANGSVFITLSSLVSHQPGRVLPHYGASKAALNHLTKSLANEWAQYQIRVNSVSPGALSGDAWEQNLKVYAKEHGVSIAEARDVLTERQLQKIPLKKMGTEEEVAYFIEFLLSDKSTFTTGACFVLDGGVKATV
jgi:NAD(P)-dependent dehydrogenase (short-subunit alcohol dehydrogenase family)